MKRNTTDVPEVVAGVAMMTVFGVHNGTSGCDWVFMALAATVVLSYFAYRVILRR